MSATDQDIYQPEILLRLRGKAVLIITGDQTEDLEFFYPYYRFVEAGYRVDVVTPKGGSFKGKQGLGLKQSKSAAGIDPEDYEMLYLPGGKAPAELKENPDILALTRRFVLAGKTVAAVCHGPQILAAAKVIDGKQIAAFPEIKDEVVAAGANFVNQETVVDGLFITARWPGDLPTHMKHVLQRLEQGKTLKSAA